MNYGTIPPAEAKMQALFEFYDFAAGGSVDSSSASDDLSSGGSRSTRTARSGKRGSWGLPLYTSPDTLETPSPSHLSPFSPSHPVSTDAQPSAFVDMDPGDTGIEYNPSAHPHDLADSFHLNLEEGNGSEYEEGWTTWEWRLSRVGCSESPTETRVIW